jgi:hypothetical protein
VNLVHKPYTYKYIRSISCLRKHNISRFTTRIHNSNSNT